jgi:hypothetical protein
VVFSINGVAQQTNSSAPYQFSWVVPFSGGNTYAIAATARDNMGNSTVSTVQVTAVQTPARPIIVPRMLNGSSLGLQVNAQAGFNYVLQMLTQMTPADWTAIQTNSGTGVLTFTIPINASAQQFFRILVQ